MHLGKPTKKQPNINNRTKEKLKNLVGEYELYSAIFVLTRVPLKVLEKTLKSKPPNFSHRATMVLPRLRSMQTFSKFALIYVSIDQLVRYFMGSFVILFFFFSCFISLFFPYYWLTFIFRLVVCCLFFVCFAQIFPWISFYCVLLCTLHEPPYALNLWSSFNLSKMILIPSFFFFWNGGVGGEEKGARNILFYFVIIILFKTLTALI